MSQTTPFRLLHGLPVITAKLFGRGHSVEVNLVLDTGAALTQVDTPIIDQIGYSGADAIRTVSAVGPAGPLQQGYLLKIAQFDTLGLCFTDFNIATYDFDQFSDEPIDGLLGFDVIGKLKLEIDSPARLIKIL